MHLKNISPREKLIFGQLYVVVQNREFLKFSLGKFIFRQLVMNFADAKAMHISEITCKRNHVYWISVSGD